MDARQVPLTTMKPLIEGSFGVVTTTHYLASAIAMGILERGGNAVDAAVAAGFALQVAEPNLSGPAGEAPIMVYTRRDGKVHCIDGQGGAPRSASLEAFQALGQQIVPGTGLLAATVPSAFAAWLEALRRFGTLHLEDVLSPAVQMAREGISLLPTVCGIIQGLAKHFTQHWPSSAEVYLPGGQLPRMGEKFRNPQLARVYQRLIEEERAHRHLGRERALRAAHNAFYSGFVAEAIDTFCRDAEVYDVTGERHRAFLNGEDLAGYQVRVEPSQSVDYNGFTVHKGGFWSQGPVFLQQLRLLEGFDLRGMGLLTPEYLHTIIECAKLAFADREAYYGDPEFATVPSETLLSSAYAQQRRQQIDAHSAARQMVPGQIPGFEPQLDFLEIAARGARGELPPGDHIDESNWAGYLAEGTTLSSTTGDTVHIDIIDRDGNMVSATPSGGWLLSSPAIPGLGFPLGTRAQIFWLLENHPNCIAPAKRPRTTLSPTLVTREGEPYLALGTPGGDQQDQWPLHLLLAHLHFGLTIQQAIELPGFHSKHFPSSFAPRASFPGTMALEDRLGAETVKALEKRGHTVQLLKPWVWEAGRELAAQIDTKSGILRAAASPRGYSSLAIGR